MRFCRFPLILVVASLAAAGCATHAEWEAWRDHASHFASGDHLAFSLRNRDVGSASVTSRDVREAKTEGWWGDPVRADPSQILTR